MGDIWLTSRTSMVLYDTCLYNLVLVKVHMAQHTGLSSTIQGGRQDQSGHNTARLTVDHCKCHDKRTHRSLLSNLEKSSCIAAATTGYFFVPTNLCILFQWQSKSRHLGSTISLLLLSSFYMLLNFVHAIFDNPR